LARDALAGRGPLLQAVLWNSGFLLWRCQRQSTLEAGIAQAAALLHSHQVQSNVEALIQFTHRQAGK